MIFNPMKNPIFLFKVPIKINQNHEGLCAIIREKFGEDFIYSGAAFVFIARNRLSSKIILYDGSGILMVHKKFLVKAFGYSTHLDEVSKISIQELELLFSGDHISISLEEKS
ncbi:IS66 family insertion sequence element accessory protein TnpB [Bacteriovoracaceae bacterium]|nr:IS66 family insertion sequence element accessory protein TnpB [Bacteriovoracaceae bacterium]